MADSDTSETASAKKPRRRWWRWVRRIYKGVKILLLVAILLAVAYVLITNHVGEKRLQDTLADLRARGIRADLDALSPRGSTIGDTEDGTRFYLAAFDLTAGIPRLRESPLPYVGRGLEPELCRPIELESGDELRSFVQTHRGFYALFEKARGRPARYPVENGVTADRALAGLRQAARFQFLRSLHGQAIGDSTVALDGCAAALDASRSFRESPETFALLMRHAVGIGVSRTVEQALSRIGPSVPDMQRLRAGMLAEAKSLAHKRAIEAEIALLAEQGRHVQRYMAEQDYRHQKMFARGSYARTRDLYADIGRFVGEGENLPSEATYRLAVNGARVWSMVCPGAYKIWFCNKIDQVVADREAAAGPTWDLATYANRILRETDAQSDRAGWIRAILVFIEAQARMKVGATALAVESYRVQRGAWPDALADSDGDTTVDPFTGEPLKYVTVPGGRLVYSVGGNLRDDDGVEDGDLDEDDIAFRLIDVEKRNKP